MRNLAIFVALMFVVSVTGCGKKDEPAPQKQEAVKSDEAKKAEEAKAAEEAKKAEEAKMAEEAKAADEAKKAEEAKAAEEAKVAEEAKAAEEAKKAEETKAAEEAKKAEEAKAAAAAGTNDIQKRRERIQEIYKLGRSKDEAEQKKLEEIIAGTASEPYEVATAIRALGTTKRDALVPNLKTLAESPDLAVKSEAAILLYQWGEKEFAKPVMEKLIDQGVALRRAFFKGIQEGKYTYEPEAEEFFKKAMDAKQVHVKLDAALGLLHMNNSPDAIKAFQDALADQDKEYVRLTAVSYLASARDIPEARALLEAAAKDASPKVSTRAQQILGIGAQPTPAPTPAPAPAPEAAPAPAPAPAPEAGGAAPTK